MHSLCGESNVIYLGLFDALISLIMASGMNYTLITDSLIVGSQPQKPEDIDHLRKEEDVAYILNLQQDKDIEYWGIDFQSIIKRCQDCQIRHMRRPVSQSTPMLKDFCRLIA